VSVVVKCPSCGANVPFLIGSSLVAVCPHCKSAVGRSDKGLEDLGKVADLVETGSPLDLMLDGRFDRVPFTLTGQVQYRHTAGGMWDEWYAAFADGRWGWLAEAQGRFYLTFEQPAPADLPSYDALEIGQRVKVADQTTLIVAEKNRGQTAGGQGEIPYRFVPNQEHPFADLSGPQGEFGTLDYSGPAPVVYLGREVTLDELGIPPSARRKPTFQEASIQGVQLNCPKCGGALELRAPDRSERVGCPYCGSLLDVQQGQLKLLQSLEPPPIQPIIPLGSKGNYQGIEWLVIGFMQRSVRLEGTEYFWEEYLLYQPRRGFRWLTRSDDHWNQVEPLPPGAVIVEGHYATYADRPYRLYQRAKARVVFVLGEFYWKVQAGEKVQCRDFVSPPEMLSEEVTKEGKEGEINWSKGTYLEPAEVRRMFNLPPLPAPVDIAPNQPFPHSRVYPYSLILAGAVLLLGLVIWLVSPHREVLRETVPFAALKSNEASRQQLVEQAFELAGHQNVCITLESSTPGWIYVEGNLSAAPPAPEPGQTRVVQPGSVDRPFSLAATPEQSSHCFLNAVPPGRYALRLDARWQNPRENYTAIVRVQQGVFHPSPLVIALLLIGLGPLLVGLYQILFEARRWLNSNIR
jgi:DNA-directed RNA polymerase subunit RPC12/RpoP